MEIEDSVRACEPHDPTRPFIGVVDKKCRIRWSSSEANVGECSMDFYPPSVRPAVFEKFSNCIVMQKPECFTAEAFDQPTEPRNSVTWKVTMLPFDFGELACIVLATIVPCTVRQLSLDDLSVLRLMAKDKPLKDIAHAMNRSKSAIDARIKCIKSKLNCQTIGGLVAFAMQSALI